MESKPAPGSYAWLSLVREDIIDPQRPIIDPHHHLWPADWRKAYLLEDLWRDTSSGHRIEKTVFVECQASYRDDGPDHLKPLGETTFVANIARASRAHQTRHGEFAAAEIAGFVGHANLTLEISALRELLQAHVEHADGLFRGIRHAGARDSNPKALSIPGRAPERLYADPQFRQGVALLGELGFSFDTWHYHHQNLAYLDLARATPGTQFILDHFGTPLGVGEYVGQRDAIYQQWKLDIAEIAKCPNVVAKLGGLAMPDCGYGWELRDRPASSDELVAAQQDYYHHAIACFGPARCMFESNFPVDKRSLSYATYWNAMKKIAARYSEEEQHAMFYGTAAKIYRLGVSPVWMGENALIIDTVTIGKRFNGPPQSANGGWAGGILARSLCLPAEQAGCLSYPSVSVSLRAPPPLDIALEVHRNADASLSLKHDGLELAYAQLEKFELDIPKPPPLATAIAASAEGYQRGLSRASWPYAKCFACGVSRTDGLCITPSPVSDSNQGGVIVAIWTPSAWLAETEGSLDGLVRLEAIWAALDCPAGIAWSFQLPDGAPMVTARMSVSITRLPRVNQEHIVMGWPIEREGRKLYAGTALMSAEGEVLASSSQLWLLPKVN